MFIRKISRSFLILSLRNSKQKPICFYFSDQNRFKFDLNKDYYDILDIPKDASKSELLHGYHRMQQKYEKDLNKGPGSRFMEVSEAFYVLSDDDLREQYHLKKFKNDFDSKIHEEYEKKYKKPAQKLTPEEEEYYAKFNKYLKIVLILAAGYFIFSPFILWDGRNKTRQEVMQESINPRRMGGMYLNKNYQAQQGTQNQYPNQGYQQNWNPQGITVTGQMIED